MESLMTRFSYRWISILLVTLSWPIHVFAQGTDVRGIVSDSVTSQRIPFANVYVLNTTRGASSNTSGFYLIPNLPPGEYDIVASVIGYRRKVEHVIARAGTSIDLNFPLAPTPVENAEVLVTAARKTEVTEVKTSVHLLDRTEIKRAPSIAQEDVFQSLKLLPGIVSTSDVSSRFYVRGGAGDQNLVLLDGMKIFNPFHALGIFSAFDPDIVQNVEVYTGAFPAGYGGRLSSVESITSRDGRSDRIAGRASLTFLSSKVQLEGPAIGGTTWMINGRKSVFAETFKRIANQDIPVSFYDLFSKFNARFPGGAKLDFSMLLTSDELPLSQNPQGIPASKVTEPDYRWRTSAFSGAFSDLVGNRVFIQTTVYYTSYQAYREPKSTSLNTPASNLVREHGLRTLATYYTDAKDLCLFGFDFGFPRIDYKLVNLSGSSLNISDSYVDGQAWMRYQVHSSRWLADIGVHADFGSMVAGEQGLEGFQPRVLLTYEVAGNWKAKASFGIFSQRSITVNDENDVMPVFDAWIKVPSNLKPEKASHLVLGIDGNITESASLGLETYYKDFSSLVVFNRDKILDGDPDYITGKGSAYGAELLIRSRLGIMDIYATYALSWTTVDNRGLDYYPRYDRRHHVNILASVQPLNHFDVSVRWEFGSGFPFTATIGYYDRLMLGNPLRSPFENETGLPYVSMGEKNAARLPVYHRMDLSAIYRFSVGGILGSLGGQIINLYDHRNVFTFDRNTGQQTDMLHFFPSATATLEF
jgi:hypothetical protein